MSKSGNTAYAKVPSDSAMDAMGSGAKSGKTKGKNTFREKCMAMSAYSMVIGWAYLSHFGISFLRTSIYLSVFYSATSIDASAALTLAMSFAFLEYSISTVFNHQHLTFNLTAGFILAWRKLIFRPLPSCYGKKDVFGNNNTTRMERIWTFGIEMLNCVFLLLGSIVAASFSIKVIFPQKEDGENWKFISHTRDSLTQMDIFVIAIIGFTFLAVMVKQLHKRLKTDVPICGDDVSNDVDCATSYSQASSKAAISFVSTFWLFVTIKSPNNLVVMIGPAMIADDYSNLGILFAAEILVWTVVELAYYMIHRSTDGKYTSKSSIDYTVANNLQNMSSDVLAQLAQQKSNGYGDKMMRMSHNHYSSAHHHPAHATRY